MFLFVKVNSMVINIFYLSLKIKVKLISVITWYFENHIFGNLSLENWLNRRVLPPLLSFRGRKFSLFSLFTIINLSQGKKRERNYVFVLPLPNLFRYLASGTSGSFSTMWSVFDYGGSPLSSV